MENQSLISPKIMETPPLLDILFQDEYMVIINKPHGIAVHRSPMVRDQKVFVLQTLRNQIDQHVYAPHRLDSKTSGILIFALSKDVEKKLQQLFVDRQIKKTYWAVVRGYTLDNEVINYDLTNAEGKTQEAVTAYRVLQKTELPIPFRGHATSRYTWLEVFPETGRYHQIRKHMSHIRHPIIGDRPHGCNKQNKFFKDNWGMVTMLLHARSIEFEHPVTSKKVQLNAPLQPEFQNAMGILNFNTDHVE